jgi:hypothetical protein
MEFGYDGKHGVYQPHNVGALAVSPSSQPVAATMGTFAIAPGSPLASARAPPASGRAPLPTPESSRAATRRGKKQNILIQGLKTLISIYRSNNTLIHESHQWMSQTLSHLEECQCEMCTSMGLETPEPTIFPPLPPPAVEDPWAWYCNTDGNDEDDNDEEIEEDSE